MRRLALGLLALLLLAGCTGSGGGKQAAASGPAGSPGSSSTPAPGSATGSTPPASSGPSSAAAAPRRSAQSTPGPKLTAFRVADVTYVGSQAWALGTAQCLSGSGRCSGIEHSSDGGRTWSSLPTPPGATVVLGSGATGCRRLCLRAIRFATTGIGYLFGAAPDTSGAQAVLYLTTDGGHSWRSLAGGADALESLDGNVIRIVSATRGCPPGCAYRAQTSGIGSMAWRTVALPGTPSQGDGATLVRTGHYAYLLTVGHPAGGGDTAHAVLYTSADDGGHWVNRREPCPQSGRVEVDAAALTSAPDGSVTVLCQQRGGQRRTFIATSTQHGRAFAAGSRTALGGAEVTALGAASARIVLVSSDQTYRSTDGGRHFARVGSNGGSAPGQLAWLGFASATVGHGISTDHRSIWTTSDGGRSWTRHRFA
jgi:photosystem II stability/assembly factor-like uncharacterized protein